MVRAKIERKFSEFSELNHGSLPMLRMANTTRNNIVAVLGEFVGTFLFLFFSFAGTQMANTPLAAPGSNPNLPSIIFTALAFGVSLTANVTLALMICGGLPPIRGLLIVPTQIIAGLCAAGVASALFPGPLAVATSLGGGANIAQGFFIEVFLTTQLVFVILMLAVEKHRFTFLAPVGIGLSFFLAELTGVYFTGGSLNPARSFGPAAVVGDFPNYHWIYWLAPAFGSMVACGFYVVRRQLRYYECNPAQESNGHESGSEPSVKG
ncbi:Aquaporin-1 [Colletotrichum shisoi]|uniref:Aquaporin-1 n=1 Tax=Colletotrichum shisoi TaxID=2078593 RepID=A0A5Q4BEQ4_9PEZI|nr:Aquaporin-1 [Colletotrichum shisoi]